MAEKFLSSKKLNFKTKTRQYINESITLALNVSTSAFKTLLSTADALYFWLMSERRFNKLEFSTLSWETYIKTMD